MAHRRALRFAALLILAVGVPFLSGASEGTPRSEGTSVRDVDPRGADALIRSSYGKGDLVILDVRTPGEHREERIPGSVLVDYRGKDFRERLNALDRTKAYLVYCRTGNRSTGAIREMREMGFRKVDHLVGGITRWKAEGLATEK